MNWGFRLWAKIAATLAVNLALLAALGLGMAAMQSRRGLDSFLYTQARERIRDLGAMVEDEFPNKAANERDGWLKSIGDPYGVRLAVYDDTGTLVAGPDLHPPEVVLREIDRDRPKSRRRARAPMFLQKEASLYWIGYHFPITMKPGDPPVRHTLTVVTDSLLTSPLLIDWTPWIIGAAGTLLVSALCWIPLLRRVTGALRAVRHASAEIAQGRFETPIAVTGRDELGDLAQSVRQMAEQLSRLVHGQRRFLADIAHELCAPLSRMQLSAGILKQNAPQPLVAQVERLERDATHMSALVGDLLSFTKEAAREPHLVPVALAELVRSVAAQENADVQIEIDPQLRALADADYLRRAIANVVRNAVRYASGPGGGAHIRSYATAAGSIVQLIVEDDGPGLPEGELKAVFSPFYRLDDARTPGSTNGAGLGLAIVKSCVEACQGTVFCRNRAPKGLDVVIELRRA